jgi:hypothetical protein
MEEENGNHIGQSLRGRRLARASGQRSQVKSSEIRKRTETIMTSKRKKAIQSRKRPSTALKAGKA